MKQSKLSKLLLATVLAGLTLTACEQKPQETTAPTTTETPVKADEKAATTAETAEKDGEQHEHDDKHEGHDHDDKHNHDGHDHHDHAHGHDHHHDGDKYQCGDKSVIIAIHNHDGEMEAHLTDDDIQYDLNPDTANPQHYTTKNGIQGDGKPMTLMLDGDKAKVVAADQSVLLDCTKAK